MMNEALEIARRAVEIYATQHPRPYHVTQKQCAEMTGKSQPTIGKMVKAGTLKLNKFGMIPIECVDDAIRG